MTQLHIIKRDLERLKRKVVNTTIQHIAIDWETYSFSIPNPSDPAQDKVYIPSKTALAFHQNHSLWRHIMGPFGSGKTTMTMADAIFCACRMPLCKDGIRRARIAIIRNTTPELVTSVFPSWVDWFGNLGDCQTRQNPLLKATHFFNDEKGRIEIEVIFMACDKDKDVKKLKSTEFTFALLSEACELPQTLMDVIKGRIGRYPAKHMCEQEFWSGVISDTNPPDTDHWMYNLFEIEKPNDYVIFKQPSGLLKDDSGKLVKDEFNNFVTNPHADNLEHLQNKDYYINQAKGSSEEFVKVYCCGDYGILRHGKAVYPQYNDDLHSVDYIEIDNDSEIYLGFDFGVVTPACLVAQYSGGQLRFIKEFCGDNSAFDELFTHIIWPWISANLPGMSLIAVHDPADKADDIYNVKCSEYLADHGITTNPAFTNNPEMRINTIQNNLNQLSFGKPALLLSRRGCPILRKGFLGDYEYRKLRVVGENKFHEKPYKSHPVSDIHDCAQYIAMEIDNPSTSKPIDSSMFIDNSRFI